MVEGSNINPLTLLAVGDGFEVEWPCEQTEGNEVCKLWFTVEVVAIRQGKRFPHFTLRFEDGIETEHSLRDLNCRSFRLAASSGDSADKAMFDSGSSLSPGIAEETTDSTGYVHMFEIQEEFLEFCDWLHENREVYGDKTRGDAAYGEDLRGNIVSVLVRREALPQKYKELYNRLHHQFIEEVPRAWPGWLRKAGGKDAKARPSQDLRLLQYSAGAQFKAHVDSGWACQGLIYLNAIFSGGYTEFPNLQARYRPRRGRALLWRNSSVGHKPVAPGRAHDDHPSLHVAGEVFDGTKRVVSINLVLA